jgi:hypothetical protein
MKSQELFGWDEHGCTSVERQSIDIRVDPWSTASFRDYGLLQQQPLCQSKEQAHADHVGRCRQKDA